MDICIESSYKCAALMQTWRAAAHRTGYVLDLAQVESGAPARINRSAEGGTDRDMTSISTTSS